MNGQTNPSKRVDADRLRRAGFPEAMIAEAVARDAKGVLNHEPPGDLVARTIKACEPEFAMAAALPNRGVRVVDVWQSAIETLIMHGFSPRTVRFVARAALATGSGRNDDAWRARLAALASYEAMPRPVWLWLAALIDIPRVRPRVAVSILCLLLVGVVSFAAFTRNGVSDKRIGVTASAEKLAFPPINVEEDGSATLRPDSEIYAMAARFRETKFGAFQQ